MAWTGTPIITSLGKHIVRITGVSLAGSTSATIGLNGGSGDLSLPSTFPSIALPAPLTLVDLVRVSFVHTNPGGGGESRHVHVDKTDSPFLITFTNDQGAVTSTLEIYVEHLHTLVR